MLIYIKKFQYIDRLVMFNEQQDVIFISATYIYY